MKLTRTLFVSCLCLTVLAPSAPAQDVGMAVGNSGQLYRTMAGTYGELFADDAFDPAVPVLAIEIDPAGDGAPGEGTSRLLVPGTGDARIETDPRLFHDSRYDSLVVLWNSVAADGEIHLEFATFDGIDWSQVYSLEEDDAPASITGALVEATHDAFDLDLGEGDPISLDRRVIHVLWRDRVEPAAVKYAPLTFVEGHYVGWNDLVVLSEALLKAADPEDVEAQLTPALAATLSLRTADDDRSVLATFADSRSHRIGTAAIIPQPLEVDVLGDLVRERILALADQYDPEDTAGFSDVIRAGIVPIGYRLSFNPAHVDYLAAKVADWIALSKGVYGYDLEGLADDARSLAIDVGNEVYISSTADPSDPDSEIMTVDVSALLGAAAPAQVVHIRGRSDRPAPAIGDGPTTIHVSRDGRDLLIAWEAENGELRWVESRHRTGGAWSETFSLTLGESLSLAAAHELLARKIR